MAEQLNPIEAKFFVAILKEATCQLAIVKHTLLPKHPFIKNLPCVKLQSSLPEQNIWKAQLQTNDLYTVLIKTISSLKKTCSFNFLKTTVDQISKRHTDDKKTLEIAQVNRKILVEMKDEMVEYANRIKKAAYPGMKSMLINELKEKENAVEKLCARRKDYSEKFCGEFEKSNLNRWKSEEDKTRTEIGKIKQKITQEMRNTQEMQSYLQLARINLAEKLEKCMLQQDESVQVIENRMLRLRIRKSHLEELSAQGEELIEQRRKDLMELKLQKDKKDESEAVASMSEPPENGKKKKRKRRKKAKTKPKK